jgi:hypothetical protein
VGLYLLTIKKITQNRISGILKILVFSSFYIVAALYSVLGDLSFSARIIVVFSTMSIVSNLFFNWIEQSYLRFQEDLFDQKIAFFCTVVFISSLGIYLSFQSAFPAFSQMNLYLIALIAMITALDVFFRYVLTKMIVKNQENTLLRFTTSRLVIELAIAFVAFFISDNETKLLTICLSGLLSRIISIIPVFETQYLRWEFQNFPKKWIEYGINVSIFGIIFQMYSTYINNQVKISVLLDTKVLLFSKYASQMTLAVGGIILTNITPILFRDFTSTDGHFFRFSKKYSIIFLAISAIPLLSLPLIGNQFKIQYVFLTVISSLAWLLSSLSQKTVEIANKSHIMAISAVIACVTSQVFFISLQLNVLDMLFIPNILYYLAISFLGYFLVERNSHTTYNIFFSLILFSISVPILVNQ